MTTGKKSLRVRVRIRRAQRIRRMNAPKQVEEAKRFDEHANERPFEEDEEDAAEETDRPANLLFTSEEGDGFLRADDKCETGYEENL